MAVTGSSDDAIVAGLNGWMISMLGLLTLLLGSGLFALATWRARSLARWASALLGLGSLAVVPGIVGLAGALVPEAILIVSMAAAILAFGVGWIGLGLSALRITGPDPVSLEGASL